MGTHLINGQFQSDKYPTTPAGKVPLSCKDPTAQDLLWEYAQRRRLVDAEFSADLEKALCFAGFVPKAASPEAVREATELDDLSWYERIREETIEECARTAEATFASDIGDTSRDLGIIADTKKAVARTIRSLSPPQGGAAGEDQRIGIYEKGD